MKTIKVIHTLYGYKGYIGAERAKEFSVNGEEFEAKEWLSEMLATGAYKLSDKSDISMADIEAHRERMAEPVRRIPTMESNMKLSTATPNMKFSTAATTGPLLTVTERTQAIIDQWRGLPGEQMMLKGLLCVGIAIEAAAAKRTNVYSAQRAEAALIDQHIDRIMIAARMDEITKEVLNPKPRTKVQELAMYRTAAEHDDDIRLTDAIAGAEVNAVDTFMETGRRAELAEPRTPEVTEELADLAIRSLCCTSEFDTHKEVRDFFERLGYKW
jgi:hypothetical protein